MIETRPTSIGALIDKLVAEASRDTVIAPNYKVSDLIDDLANIDEENWSNSIDAMGEDA